MAQNDKIQLFENKRIRTAWDEEKEEWYFSIVDVCEVLSGTDNPRRYWSDLKRKSKRKFRASYCAPAKVSDPVEEFEVASRFSIKAPQKLMLESWNTIWNIFEQN